VTSIPVRPNILRGRSGMTIPHQSKAKAVWLLSTHAPGLGLG